MIIAYQWKKTLLDIFLTIIHVYFMYKLAWFTAHLPSCSVKISKMAAGKHEASWEGKPRCKHSHVLLLLKCDHTNFLFQVTTNSPLFLSWWNVLGHLFPLWGQFNLLGMIIYIFFLTNLQYGRYHSVLVLRTVHSYFWLLNYVWTDHCISFPGDSSLFLILKYFFSEYFLLFFYDQPTDPNF